jgi:predicted transcriptional regulator
MSDPSDDGSRLLTQTELELMNILWRLGGGTVRDVMAALPADRDLAYTSVSTMLRILEKKEFVRSVKDQRTHRYVPAVSQSKYQTVNLRHLVRGLFGGDPMSLVRRLISSEELREDELRDMARLVEEQLGE